MGGISAVTPSTVSLTIGGMGCEDEESYDGWKALAANSATYTVVLKGRMRSEITRG